LVDTGGSMLVESRDRRVARKGLVGKGQPRAVGMVHGPVVVVVVGEGEW
jgi:hypothetical protein